MRMFLSPPLRVARGVRVGAKDVGGGVMWVMQNQLLPSHSPRTATSLLEIANTLELCHFEAQREIFLTADPTVFRSAERFLPLVEMTVVNDVCIKRF